MLAEADDSGFRLSGEKTEVMFARVQQGATLMLVAEALGIMETLLAKTLAYTRARKQFGGALAEFQMLQHRMADMYIELTNTENLFRQTVARIDTRQGDTGARISRLKARMGLAGRYIGQQAIQLHGGIGMTEELDVGHYFKRLTALDILLGGAEFHIKQIWQQSLAGPATV